MPGYRAIVGHFTLFLLLMNPQPAQATDASLVNGEVGLYPVGFRLYADRDGARTFACPIRPDGDAFAPGRPVRIYIWYPAQDSDRGRLLIRDYIQMAADDFGLRGENSEPVLPVQLMKGLDDEPLAALLNVKTMAVQGAEPESCPFPLIILGQGLYYESPFTHYALCESLAGHGYVVATCPLMGTHARLVNINAVDLETQIRDMEFVLSKARELPFVDSEELGVIGYDLGGMAGLILSMRNLDVDAFLSLDSGILFPHYSGLPNTHPNYDENRFVIPWLHVTQARFGQGEPSRGDPSSLMDRKRFGDSYLYLAETFNHGDFTSYAAFRITKAVPGYWSSPTNDSELLHEQICLAGREFFDAYLKDDGDALSRLQTMPGDPAVSRAFPEMIHKPGQPRHPHPDDIVQEIIEKGFEAARPTILEARKTYPDSLLFREPFINWLGYHFLYWWGRESEAVEVFKLNTEIFPQSANAFDSLGEAYSFTGNREKAIESYRRSLELNPENQNAREILEQLD
ncbi:MAG: hypothetical protein KJ970_17070 [Candidatus Eisenbacteria bacterium]|uniref:Tetratricopeptide repeat protein n=1 Tax=Eiseniibacteriota bacterium TaxID=2212470 RepID=A0A948S2G9_UNCEI|nr:hypothetical protein [Candidatus Eisenbacteria bacterium]MBU1949047.1 hypothetical protein [Candidatus Eisenbacteria bacterium]MBU2692629.1 hypothetical protein [Candidatus Eisenbacteria bacterium]